MEKEWIAEFVLRQPIPPSLLNRILVSLSPLPNPNPNLKKTLLLRRVLSHLPTSISAQTLTSLELLQTLNPNPNPNPDLLRTAYLHSAVASTLAPLLRGDLPAFLRAVDATWRRRLGDLERSPAAAAALASEGLAEWRRRMEAAAAADAEARDEVLAAWDRKGGVDAIAEYVRAELAAMGPTFLERAARREMKGKGKRKRKAVNDKRVSNCIPTPEVHKVREALIRSSKALQNVVEDPLPHAKEVADSLIAHKLGAGMHVDEQKESCNLPEGNQNNVDKSAQVHSADKAAEGIGTRSTHVPAKATKVSILDRNPTARTYEWEDGESLDSSEDGSLPSKKPHLPTPRTRPSSPLKVLKVNKAVISAKGRKRRKWSVLEEDTLREAVNKYGKGNWKQILNCYRDVFEERTEVDLKDKWRNMTR